MDNYILFQAYGPKRIFDECRFFLIRFFATASEWEKENIKIIIYTDDKKHFNEWINILPNIFLEVISAEEIKDWRGEIDFVHRVKIKIFQKFFSEHEGNLIYCDTDTYPTGSLRDLFNEISKSNVYMHVCEGGITPKNNFKKWHHFLKSGKIHIDNALLSPVININMWNAGVIGLNSGHKNLLSDVLALTDAIYPSFKKHTVEQFAFSYVFQKYGDIKSAEKYLFHYWGLKEFAVLLDKLFGEGLQKNLSWLMTSCCMISPETILNDKMKFKSRSGIKKIFLILAGKGWKISNYLPKDIKYADH